MNINDVVLKIKNNLGHVFSTAVGTHAVYNLINGKYKLAIAEGALVTIIEARKYYLNKPINYEEIEFNLEKMLPPYLDKKISHHY